MSIYCSSFLTIVYYEKYKALHRYSGIKILGFNSFVLGSSDRGRGFRCDRLVKFSIGNQAMGCFGEGDRVWHKSVVFEGFCGDEVQEKLHHSIVI